MTSINAMKFNATEGGMVTDSQSSSGTRKYDFADKVVPITCGDTYALIGGSGRADLIYEATSVLTNCIKSNQSHNSSTVSNVAELLSNIMIDIKRKNIGSYLQSNYGITPQTALSGQGVGPHLLPEIKEILTANVPGMKEAFNNGFIVIGKDNQNVGIYSVWMGYTPSYVPQPYFAIGSGTDESDKVLRSFIKKQSRDGRKEISLIPGMAALIRATNASSEINQGVGGTPTISYFDQNGITILGEEESKLAAEIVKVGDAQLITPNQTMKGLESLLYKTRSVDCVEQKTFKQSPNKYDQIMRFLRGFKI